MVWKPPRRWGAQVQRRSLFPGPASRARPRGGPGEPRSSRPPSPVLCYTGLTQVSREPSQR